MSAIKIPFLANSKGQGDGTWTLTVLAFILVVSLIALTAAGFGVEPGSIDQALNLLYAVGAGYITRRGTRAWEENREADRSRGPSSPDRG